MPRFAANLSMLWQELDHYERFEAAATEGSRMSRCSFRTHWTRIASTLRSTGWTGYGDLPPGRW